VIATERSGCEPARNRCSASDSGSTLPLLYQDVEPAAQLFARHVEAAPLVLITTGDSVIAENQQAMAAPATGGEQLRHARGIVEAQHAELGLVQHAISLTKCTFLLQC
jgi:hypothetical protein